MLLPLGIVELSGERYLYATRVGFDPVAGQWFNAPLVRFTWHQDYGLLYPSNFPATTVPYSLTEIVLDTDGSLLSWDTGTADLGGGSIARQVRSRNQGLTWALTGLTIAARPGQFIADCHTLHNPGGVVVTPLVVECVTGTDGDWSKAGNWTRTLATWSGAVIPANMMVAAVQIPSGVPPAWWSAPRPAAAAVVTPGPRRTPPPLLWPLPRPTQAPTP